MRALVNRRAPRPCKYASACFKSSEPTPCLRWLGTTPSMQTTPSVVSCCRGVIPAWNQPTQRPSSSSARMSPAGSKVGLERTNRSSGVLVHICTPTADHEDAACRLRNGEQIILREPTIANQRSTPDGDDRRGEQARRRRIHPSSVFPIIGNAYVERTASWSLPTKLVRETGARRGRVVLMLRMRTGGAWLQTESRLSSCGA